MSDALFVIAIGRGQVALPRRADLPIVLSITALHMVGFSMLMAVSSARLTAPVPWTGS